MRRFLIAVAAFTLLAAASRVTDAQVSAAAAPTDSVTRALSAFSLTREGVELNGRFARGDLRIEAGDTIRGAVVTVGGNADIHGFVAGGVYALWGDVTVHRGAEIIGGANAYQGRVIIDGGTVRGALHAWPAAVAAAEPVTPLSTGGALRLAAGWVAMMLVVALLVLVVASGNLESTARALEQDFGRTFFIGVMGQLGFLPLLLLAVVALAVTVVGVLLVPFVLVAAPIAFAGFVTLGWVALALVTGRALMRSRQGAGSRAEAVRALVLGVALLMVPWLLAAAFQSAGSLALFSRIAAIAITWVAATAGLGATLVSRAGSARAKADAKPQPLQGWATPTPVAGVATARRPIPARPGATPK